MALANALHKAKDLLTPRHSQDSFRPNGFRKAPEGQLFPKVDPAVDGEDCDHDCASCEFHLPRGFKIDETENLYGHVNGWATHILVATGKTDWVRDVTDEKGSVMEAVGQLGIQPSNGKLMLSASNIPVPESSSSEPPETRPTTILLLPSFTLVDGVTPSSVKHLLNHYIEAAPTTTSTLVSATAGTATADSNSTTRDIPPTTDPSNANGTADAIAKATAPVTILPANSSMTTRPCPHRYLILMCSQRTRDVRCGQSAPILKRELERHLRPLGLYRDCSDERPGGVGIYFISHVGGHKFSANVMVYRRGDGAEASQCIWLARVRPEDCEGIVKFTVLQGKVVKPERQLRGGFDREKGLVSW